MSMQQGTIRTLLKVYSKYRLHIALLCVFGVLGALLEGIGINAAIPLISFFQGGGVPADPISRAIATIFAFVHIPFSFRYLLGFILALFFFRAVAVATFSYIRGWIMADFFTRQSSELFGGLLHASWPYLLRQKIGYLQTAMVRDVQRAASLLDMLSQVIQSATGFVMYVVVAFAISPLMTAITLMGALVLLTTIRPLLRRTVRAGEEMSTVEREISQFLSEHIIGMKLAKAGGVVEAALSDVRGLLQRLRQAQVRMALVRSASSSLFQPFSLLFVIILFVLMYKTPGFNIISFAATLYLIQKIFTYAESAQSSLHGVGELLPYLRHLDTFKAELVEAREHTVSGGKPFRFERAVELENVSLSYGEKFALQDVTARIERGSFTGLIGPSGAGKTSFADLLLRLFDPQEGQLLLDNIPANEINIDEWRGHVAYVPQEVFLFNASVAHNVRFYRPDITDEDIVEALKRANIYETIEALPEGINTMVGDRGVLLSGGQRQRIALARALVGHPAILVLDEATSALDTESERLIQEAIGTLHGSVTVFVIAHRLSTIESADVVLVLEDGRITEQGSPRELLANPDSYFSRHYH